MPAVDLVSNMPEFKLVESYIDSINHLVEKLDKDSPYGLLTHDYYLKVDVLKRAVFDLRVEYATQFKFM